MSASFSSTIDDPNLLAAVEQLIFAHPESESVIQRLIAYYDAKLEVPDSEEREHKKRKIDTASNFTTLSAQATIPDVSFQIPARKKYNLILTSTHLILSNPKTNEAEYTYQLQDFELGACVPNPGAAKGDTYALFLKTPDTDPVVFSIPQKGSLVIKRDATENTVESDNKRDTLVELLTTEAGISITTPEKQIYRSTLVSSTTGKPSEETKFHANAYLKAKDGSLYFLPKGILYGFKKPTIFFPFSCIASTHYCGIMQHTFNIALVLHKGRRPLGSAFAASNKDDEETTVEFSMIEQSEYGGIDAYIKKIGINDKSMSEELRAPEIKQKNTDQNVEDATLQDDNGHFRPTDDEEENDDDFHPSDDDEDPLEYDSEAGSSDEMEDAEDDDSHFGDLEDHTIHDEKGAAHHDAEVDLEQASGSDPIEGASEQDVLVSEDEEEQDISRTDNETEDEHDFVEEELDEEEELVELEEDDNQDDDRSESLGSSSDQDIDEEMHDASIGDDEAKDELDDSD